MFPCIEYYANKIFMWRDVLNITQTRYLCGGMNEEQRLKLSQAPRCPFIDVGGSFRSERHCILESTDCELELPFLLTYTSFCFNRSVRALTFLQIIRLLYCINVGKWSCVAAKLKFDTWVVLP